MKRNLSDYIKIYHNHIDKNVCEETIKQLSSVNWEQHFFYDYNTDSNVILSGNNELDMSYDNVTTRPILMNCIWQALDNYIRKDFNFSWFPSWDGYTGLRFNRYQDSKVMANHCDHIHSMFDGERKGIPTLTVLGVLNDDYEGGNFVMFEDEIIELKQGDIMVFPSIFLYPHKVEPVTKGTRYTFVSWAW